MSTPARSRSAPLSRGKKAALWLLAALPVVLVGGYFGGRAWAEAYLRSEDFRRFVSRKTATTFHADGEFAPLHFTGLNVYSDGFKARGSERAGFASLAIDQIRAEFSLRRWKERVWQIENLEVQRIEAQLHGSRIALVETPRAPSDRTSSPGGGWLPNRIEVASAVIREFNIGWGATPREAGSLGGVALNISRQEEGWDIAGNGGRIAHHGLPSLDVGELKLRYKEPALFVQRAEFRQGATGTVAVEGEVRLNDALDLRATLAGIDLAPFLSDDWRVRLRGFVAGEVRVQSALPARGGPIVTGAVRLVDGHLEALPVLEEIAAFTRLQQYRRLALSRATTDFRHENGTLTASNLILESEALIRVEGGFTVADGNLDGTFQVGVTPTSLQWLPGSQARVFTEARGGYLWAPMRLTGPLEKPREDLSPRLIAAAKGAVLEKVETTVNDALDKGKDAVKGALDLLMPLFK